MEQKDTIVNEHLQLIADTAWAYANDNSAADDHGLVYTAKLAELIVKECARIADDGYGSDNFGNGITGHQLLDHFGITSKRSTLR